MPRLAKKVILIVAFLLVGGILRWPLEKPLAAELRAERLIAKPLDARTSHDLDQTSIAIAMGGLRSLVAAMINLSDVITAWQDDDWLRLFGAVEQIHTLQPEVPYYWKSAARYAADDAYSYYGEQTKWSEGRRRIYQQEVFDKGVAYLDEGIATLPEEQALYELKARFYSDRFKSEQVDYEKAASVVEEALALPTASERLRREKLYLISRIPKRHEEALALAEDIFSNPSMRFPSVNSRLFVLQREVGVSNPLSVEEVFGTDGRAIRSLYNHYQRRDEGYPQQGVKEELERLLEKKQLPQALNPLENPDIIRIGGALLDIYEESPLDLPQNPRQDPGDWPLVIAQMQEFGPNSPATIRVLFSIYQTLSPHRSREPVPLSLIFPDKLTALRDLANYYYDDSHEYPREGVFEAMKKLDDDLALPTELSPVLSPPSDILTRKWMQSISQHQFKERSGQLAE